MHFVFDMSAICSLAYIPPVIQLLPCKPSIASQCSSL